MGKIKFIKTPFYWKIFFRLEILVETSDVKPEVKSFTNELAFIKQNKEAIYKSLVIIGFAWFWKENIISKITQINIWINNCPIKFLNHILKIHLDWSSAKDKKANGEMIISILIKIKRTEYVKRRFINPKDIKAFSTPSKEKNEKGEDKSCIKTFCSRS